MDAEKLLGGMLRMGMGRRVGMGTKAALGLGALGVAMAAFDHFTDRSEASPTRRPATSSPGYGSAPASPPPPPPGAKKTASPPPPPGSQSQPDRNEEAILLIRAMIAAANADGQIDANERKKILDKLENAGLSGEERAFVLQELLAPVSMEAIAAQAASPDLAKKVYAVSLLAVEADTEAEIAYLQNLAGRLALHEKDIQELRENLELQ
ncbi:MAG: tellurite resistance TerB family protein [Candidatus Omnitrophica bacterium]|nr:tellurite resistance TerB family protein [Candidatus Omnitrophota bacterium]